MDTLEYLHTMRMIVGVHWAAGHASERASFGVVVATLTEIHNVQALENIRRNDGVSN